MEMIRYDIHMRIQPEHTVKEAENFLKDYEEAVKYRTTKKSIREEELIHIPNAVLPKLQEY